MAGTRRKKTVNIKQKKFVKNLVEGMGVGQAALRAGYSHTSHGSALLREPTVLTVLQAAMAKAGIDDDYLSTKIKEGLEADYPEKRAKDGSVLQAAAPDFFTRNLYLDKALKVRGDYAPERHIEQKQVLTINVNMDMARGLIDCGAITVEEIKRLDGGTDGRTGNKTRNLDEGRQAEGEAGEDRQERPAVCEEAADLDGVHVEGGVPEETQR